MSKIESKHRSRSVGVLFPYNSLMRIVSCEQWNQFEWKVILWTLGHSTYLCCICRIVWKSDNILYHVTASLKINFFFYTYVKFD